MKYSVGVDLGSTAIKVVFVQNNTLGIKRYQQLRDRKLWQIK